MDGTMTTIILAIIIIVLIYVLYVYFVSKSKTLASSASLKGTNPAITDISSGQSTRYAYSIWLYVNTWDTTSNKTVFLRNNNIQVYLGRDTPTLYCDIMLSNGNTQTITVTDNFPLQAWTCIIVSADNNIIDTYIDGKLVNSVQLNSYPQSPGDPSTDPVVLGSGWDAYVSGFKNYSGPIGPQEAYDIYMTGSGSAVSSFLSAYSINVSIDKNNVEKSSYTWNL